jgi:hypothetical protein
MAKPADDPPQQLPHLAELVCGNSHDLIIVMFW